VRRLGEARLLSLLTGLETGYMLLLDNTFFLDSTESVSLSLEIGRVGCAGRTLKASFRILIHGQRPALVASTC